MAGLHPQVACVQDLLRCFCCARYGGIVVRDAVRDGADWFVCDFDDLNQALKRHQVAFIGSGACIVPKQVPYS